MDAAAQTGRVLASIQNLMSYLPANLLQVTQGIAADGTDPAEGAECHGVFPVHTVRAYQNVLLPGQAYQVALGRFGARFLHCQFLSLYWTDVDSPPCHGFILCSRGRYMT
jgi:hypothetical protein